MTAIRLAVTQLGAIHVAVMLDTRSIETDAHVMVCKTAIMLKNNTHCETSLS